MRGDALDERLEDVTEETEEAGHQLITLMIAIAEDGVVTEREQGRLAVAVLAFGEACDRQRPIVQEIAGTIRLTRTALKCGWTASWLARRSGEHDRDMARTNRTAHVS